MARKFPFQRVNNISPARKQLLSTNYKIVYAYGGVSLRRAYGQKRAELISFVSILKSGHGIQMKWTEIKKENEKLTQSSKLVLIAVFKTRTFAEFC